MVSPLISLPPEILGLVIDELRAEHHSLVVPLAQTYNKIIYAACSDVLKYRRTLPTQHRAICDIFRQDISPTQWLGWQNSHDLSFLPLDGTLNWLSDLVLDRSCHNDEDAPECVLVGEYSDDDEDADEIDPHDSQGMLSSCRHFESIINDLISQTEAVGCKLPSTFIRFYKQYCFYKCLFETQNDYADLRQPALHKIHLRKGITGYAVEFFYDRHGDGGFSLYLDPGPSKSHAVICHTCCPFDEFSGLEEDEYQGEYDVEDLPLDKWYVQKMFRIETSDGRSYMACHELGKRNIELVATSVEVWLAGLMFWYSSLGDSAELQRNHPEGSLRRKRYEQYLKANPEMKGWNGYLQ